MGRGRTQHRRGWAGAADCELPAVQGFWRLSVACRPCWPWERQRGGSASSQAHARLPGPRPESLISWLSARGRCSGPLRLAECSRGIEPPVPVECLRLQTLRRDIWQDKKQCRRARNRVRGAGCGVLGAGCRVRGAGCWGRTVLSTRRSAIHAPGNWGDGAPRSLSREEVSLLRGPYPQVNPACPPIPQHPA